MPENFKSFRESVNSQSLQPIIGRESSGAIDLPIVTIVRLSLVPVTVAALILLLSLLDRGAAAEDYRLLAAFSATLSMLVFGEVKFHRTADKFPTRTTFFRVLTHWLLVVMLMGLLGRLTGVYTHFSWWVSAAWISLMPLALLGTQFLAQWTLRRIIRSTRRPRLAVIVGATPLSTVLRAKLMEDTLLNIRVTGFFDDRDLDRLPSDGQIRRLGSMSDLPRYVKQNVVSFVYICLPIVWHQRISQVLDELHDTTASIYFVPDVLMLDLIQARIDSITGMPTIAICETPFYGMRGLLKRSTDIVISLFILLLTWPVLLGIAIAVKLSSPGPAVFRQTRYGLDGGKIIVYKFRTMRVCEDGEDVVQAKPHDERVTALGSFLRHTSLDELPQFINVLQGRMSVVGPRPHAVAHNELYRKVIKGYMVRHKVKPGITGWAQVNGYRGQTDTLEKMQKRVEYDLDYLRNWSIGLDLWIILKTARLILWDRKAF